MISKKFGQACAVLTLAVSAAMISPTHASADIEEYIRYDIRGDKVIRSAWMNYNTDGGWLRAFARVSSSQATKVVLEKVCLQNEHGSEVCSAPESDTGAYPYVLQGSPQRQCISGLHYRSIAHWRSAGGGADGQGVMTSEGWWPCP
jgi:hypothetical protein